MTRRIPIAAFAATLAFTAMADASPLSRAIGTDHTGAVKSHGQVLGPLADLRVVPAYTQPTAAYGVSGTGFCLTAAGSVKLKFTIRNQGGKPAAASRVRVRYQGSRFTQVFDVPALAPGQQYSIQRAIPARTWAWDQAGRHVRFVIEADETDTVTEANETNNTAKSFCYSTAPRLKGTG